MGLLMLVFAAAVFGLPVEWSTAPLALPAFVLGALAFAPFGVLLVAAVVVWKQATGAAWIMAGITLLAGFYFPVALLPDWIEWTSDVQPFTPAVDLLRHLLIGIPLEESGLVRRGPDGRVRGGAVAAERRGPRGRHQGEPQARHDAGVLRPWTRGVPHDELLAARVRVPDQVVYRSFPRRRSCST